VCGAEIWTPGKAGQKYVGSFEMWCWGKMKINWTDRVRNDEVLHRDKGERNRLCKIYIRKNHWIGHILCRNCFLKMLLRERNKNG
jgi:hypothetical protein